MKHKVTPGRFVILTALCWCALLFLCPANTAAQNTGVVKFLVDNQNGYFEILVDDTLLIKRYKDTLTAGPHKAEIWSYGYDVKEVEFMVVPDTTVELYVKLDRSTAYMAYEQSYHNYRQKFHKSVTLPVSLTLSMGITAGVFMLNGYDLKRQITADINEYALTPQASEIALLKASIESNNRKYTICRYGYYVSGGLTLVGIATSLYTGLKFRSDNEEPTYSRSSPFETRSSFYIGPGGFQFIYRIG
ncbi:MAG: hypothetical protein HYZ14_12345 [Bacteroidetes bacterium]|nr:hypothetical protein [Bacteroidota bacterium]